MSAFDYAYRPREFSTMARAIKPPTEPLRSRDRPEGRHAVYGRRHLLDEDARKVA
jgi:hypothetical protein